MARTFVRAEKIELSTFNFYSIHDMPNLHPSQLMRLRQNRARARRDRNQLVRGMPTPYKADPFLTRKFRFSNNTNTTLQTFITRGNISLLYGIIYNNGSNAFMSAFAAVRILRVQMWCIYSINTGGTGQTSGFASPSLIWLSENSPDVEVSVTGNAVQTGYISSKPPEGSLAGFWTNNTNAGTQNLFSIKSPSNCALIVDVEVQYVPVAAGEEIRVPGGSFANPSPTSNVKGSYQPLDGTAANYLPVGNDS